MAYQIRYEGISLIKKPIRKSLTRIKWVTIACIALLGALLFRLKPVQDFLIPGDPEITREAFYSFAQELREGERFRDAAVVFCRQVIESDMLE